jgi:hypothetical protein
MNKEFCFECGHKNIFAVNRPKFCAGCGSPFNVVGTSTAKKKAAIVLEDEEDDGPQVGEIDISKLRQSISYEKYQNKVTLDDLWSSPAPHDSHRRPEANAPEGDDLLKQIRQECSSSKQQEIIDGE